jgi:integrase
MARITMLGSLTRRRHGTIWYRLQVPAKLRPLLGWEITRSLKTEDMEEAKRRAPAVAMWAEEKLKAARAQLDQQQPPPRAVDLEILHDAYEQSLNPSWLAWDYSLRHDGIHLGPEPDQKWRQPFSQTPLARLLGITRAVEADEAVEKAAAGGPAALDQQEPAVTLSGLLQAWAKERTPPAKTVDAWVLVLKAARSETKASMRWLPLLLAFTGARLDELCGASKGEVRSDATVARELGPKAGWYLRIEPTKDRSVKTGWRGARSTRDSWEYHHAENELLRRQNRRNRWTDRRSWIAVGISFLALVISAVALLHDINNSVRSDARGTQAEPR